jgi:hypothetical protein
MTGSSSTWRSPRTASAQVVTNERGGSVPSIDTRAIQTQVLVNNGQTVVLGGIYETESPRTIRKVPFLGDIPGVGALFRSLLTTRRSCGKVRRQQVGAADLRDAEDPQGRLEHLLIEDIRSSPPTAAATCRSLSPRPPPATTRSRPAASV